MTHGKAFLQRLRLELQGRSPFHKVIVRRKNGYSLLEMMIALALLAVLMVVAWSLMSTYQSAEQRSWKLSQRVQTLRAVRNWLESDVRHLVEMPTNPGIRETRTPNQQQRFIGTEYGFKALIRPSLNPLPFLEQMLETEEGGDANFDAAWNALPEEKLLEEERKSIWPKPELWIEFELEALPIPANPKLSRTSANSIAGYDENKSERFDLIRRELLDGATLESATAIKPTATSAGTTNLADRTLSISDLYRQETTGNETEDLTIRESRLGGLVDAKFQYFDGKTWSLQWDSDQRGKLPHAIALSFDFPSRSETLSRDELRELRKQAWKEKQNDSNLNDATDAMRDQPEPEPIPLSTLNAEPLTETNEQEVLVLIRIDGQTGQAATNGTARL